MASISPAPVSAQNGFLGPRRQVLQVVPLEVAPLGRLTVEQLRHGGHVAIIPQAVRQLDLTRVIVAHRPETIASANRVIVLNEGRVAQDLRALRART